MVLCWHIRSGESALHQHSFGGMTNCDTAITNAFSTPPATPLTTMTATDKTVSLL